MQIASVPCLDTKLSKKIDSTLMKNRIFFINLPIPRLDTICDILHFRSVIWNIRPKRT